MKVTEGRTVKTRLHLDVSPIDGCVLRTLAPRR